MQGRFKRDGSAAAEQEPRGGNDRGSSPQHAQNQGPAQAGDEGGRAALPGSGGNSSKDASTTADTVKPGTPAPVSAGSRMALRNWRISTRLVSLLALPVVAATTLGGLRITESMNDMEQLDKMQLLTEMTKQATKLATALQNERDKTAGPLSSNVDGATVQGTVTEARRLTDRAYEAFQAGTSSIENADHNDSLDSVRGNLTDIQYQLGTLKQLRQTAYTEGADFQTVAKYNRLVESLLSLSQDMAQATSNPEMIQRTRALAAFSSAKEYASIQRAIIAASLPRSGDGKPDMKEPDRIYGKTAFDDEAAALQTFSVVYSGNAEELLSPLTTGNSEITRANTYAKRALSREGEIKTLPATSYMDWTDLDSIKIQSMNQIEETLLGEMEQKARELRRESQRDAIISGALILLVLGVSLVGAFVVARSMIRSLRRLQDAATKVAQERLPDLVKHLSETDPQDIDTTVESVGVHSRDEIGQVAAAFDDVHREAVRLAAEQALLRGNVNAMFTNLSRRSQGLIQRQLSLISELESREADPDQLSSLFKLDHLATRMRRNGENLLVLAGEEPGRRWTRPVPLVDVLRAAASEVEQYERIELAAVPATEVAGRVVNDLVHLLAELLENATSFSSPQTKVRVTGHALPDGRVLVEIHDTGIGLSPEDLAAINERLASPPTVDVSVSRRMGLFVVGRLSLRHGIRIQLRPSDSGGTTALVMLPVDVAQGGKKPPAKPGANAGGQAPAGGPGGAGGAGGPGGAGRLAGGPRTALPANDGAPQQGGTGMASAFGHRAGQGLGEARQQRAQRGQNTQNGFRPAGPSLAEGQGGRRPLAQSDGPRAELPGVGNPQQRPQPAGWGNGQMDAPRGHEEAEATGPFARTGLDEQQGPGSTSEFPRPDFSAPQPGAQDPASTGQFQRPDVYGNQGGGQAYGQDPTSTGQFQRTDIHANQDNQAYGQDPASTGQFQRPDVYGNQGGGQAYGQDPTSTGQFQRTDIHANQDNQAYGQDPASTGQFQRPDVYGNQGGGQAYGQDPTSTGQFQRTDIYASQDNQAYGQDPASTGQFQRPDFGAPQDPASTGQFQRPDFGAPQQPHQPQQPAREFQQQYAPEPQRPAAPAGLSPAAPRPQGRDAGLGVPRLPAASLPAQPKPEALPPAPEAPQQPSAARPAPQRQPQRDTGHLVSGLDADPAAPAWRNSPNDELVKQAERTRKPAAGGVTTSGLPRRVPRANLVPGTAQQQNSQTGPQVSRAPDDVRGRLTNLRRGIQQGRQAGNNSSTGSFTRPTHQQEREF
ncbi:sensor histidine kinase [Streptomyces sannanensis]|uniref:sensor histidine kinase n=1 Tax=Streptomyces sannanensis TaxID=285536 RepID=UPI0031E894C0